MSLDELYREVILDHFRNPRNRGIVSGADADVQALNPTCGDEIHLTLVLKDDLVEDVRFEGKGCSISMASASMMTQAVRGRPIGEAREVVAEFRAMMRGEPPAQDLGDLDALRGVARFPVRIKCASLAWDTLEKALAAVGGQG